MTIIGWDVSTAIVGVAVFQDDMTFMFCDHFEFSKMAKDAETLHEKMASCEKWIDGVLFTVTTAGSGDIVHFFEDKLGGFTKGFTQMNTLMKLASFNTMFSYVVWRKTETKIPTRFHHIHPSTVKSIMKKEGLVIEKGADKKKLTREYVQKVEPKFVVKTNKNGNPFPYFSDMADAYITAKAGYTKVYLLDHVEGAQASPAT